MRYNVFIYLHLNGSYLQNCRSLSLSSGLRFAFHPAMSSSYSSEESSPPELKLRGNWRFRSVGSSRARKVAALPSSFSTCCLRTLLLPLIYAVCLTGARAPVSTALYFSMLLPSAMSRSSNASFVASFSSTALLRYANEPGSI